MNLRDGRPSPDALLTALPQEGRGRLKIILGAAPGVGKTFEMLTAAQARRREGLDVVAGIVETHGRKETEALVTGLETNPPPPSRIPRTHRGRDGHRRHPRPAPQAGPGR